MKIIKLHLLNRRDFFRLAACGSLSAGLLGSLGRAEQEERTVPPAAGETKKQVYGMWRYNGGVYYFDPFGLYVQKGDTVGFIIQKVSGRIPTVTAYHPDHDNHELRIPESAKPFDSGIVGSDPSKPAFQWTFDVEGTYDYFSKYHENVGMIGRIVVGKPGGPGEKPWGYGNKEGRRPIFPAVLERAKLLDSNEIVSKKAIRFPYNQFSSPYPLS